MAPPSYADLGKQARDIFSKNYRKNLLSVKINPKNQKHNNKSSHRQREPKTRNPETESKDEEPEFCHLADDLQSTPISNVTFSVSDQDFGLVKLDVKTKTPSGVDFNVSGNSNNDTGRVNCALETKYLVKQHGLTLKEKWNTDNILSSEVTLEDKIVKGLKLGAVCTFAPQSGKKTGAVKGAFKTDSLHLNSDVDFDYAGALIHGAAVLGYQGWLAGAQLSFDPSKNRLSKTNFAIGFSHPEFVLHTNVNDGQEFAGSIYQKVNDKLESGVHLAWTSSSNATRFGIGCVYKLDKDSSLRAKVNNTSQVGLGFTHRLRPGINVTINAMIDGKNFNQGGHKLGMGFELEA